MTLINDLVIIAVGVLVLVIVAGQIYSEFKKYFKPKKKWDDEKET